MTATASLCFMPTLATCYLQSRCHHWRHDRLVISQRWNRRNAVMPLNLANSYLATVEAEDLPCCGASCCFIPLVYTLDFPCVRNDGSIELTSLPPPNQQEETDMANVIGYIRVSTTMQANDGVSLDAQRAKIEAWAMLNDYDLKAIHVDSGISGKKIKNRPGLQAALDSCEKGDALVVYSLTRLSRSVRDTMDISDLLAKTGADLVSLSEKIDTTSAAGKMIFRMLSVMAQFESDQISERVKFGMDYKKSQGGSMGTADFGYSVDVDGKLIENEAEQLIITTIKGYRDAGISLRTIVSRLNDLGYVSRSGKPLGLTQVARIANG